MARYDAIAALATKDDEASRATLKAILLDEKTEHTYREEAATALGKMQATPARDILLASLVQGAEIADLRTRRAAINALATYRSDDVTSTLMRFAKSDPSINVQSAATAALGSKNPSDPAEALLLENAKTTSFRDRLRTSALRALVQWHDLKGIEPALAMAAYGQPYRTRPAAIDALGKLGGELPKEKRDPVCEFLVKLLDDPTESAEYAAATALGALGDDRAKPALQAFADGSGPENAKAVARGALSAIDTANGESASIKDLRERIETLEKARERFEKDLSASNDVEQKGRATSGPTTRGN
jgi:HEAT repeat protein